MSGLTGPYGPYQQGGIMNEVITLMECPACQKEISAQGYWVPKQGLTAERETQVTMVLVGLRVQHDCVPRVTRPSWPPQQGDAFGQRSIDAYRPDQWPTT